MDTKHQTPTLGFNSPQHVITISICSFPVTLFNEHQKTEKLSLSLIFSSNI